MIAVTPAESTGEPAKQERPLSGLLLFASFLLLSIVVYVRMRHLSVPLERDEGEYAYMGQLLLKGFKPFTLAYSMKPPGVSIIYGIFMMLFGQSTVAIRLGLLLVNSSCIFLVYLLGCRLFNRNAALFSAATYGMLSLSQSFFGNFAHATHFVVLFVLSGYLLLLSGIEKEKLSRLLASGLFMGCAFSMKQHAAPFIAFAGLCLIRACLDKGTAGKRFMAKGLPLLILGAVLPVAFMMAAMIQAGVFQKFWLWTALYAREYLSEGSFPQGFLEFAHKLPGIFFRQLPFWLIASCGIALLCRRTDQDKPVDRFFILGLLLFSLVSVCPGWYFREHYFIMLLPAIALLTGAAVSRAEAMFPSLASKGRWSGAAGCMLFLAVAYGTVSERDYFFTMTPQEASRAIHDRNPFPEAVQIGQYLKDHTSIKDRIAVLGSEPEIYFYADRLSATGHIYMYSLMENHPYARQMQMEMIREITATEPRYVVMVKINTSWGGKADSSLLLLNWGERLLREQYEQVGVIDIVDRSTTRYLWDNDAKGYNPVSGKYVTVHKRKTTAPAHPPNHPSQETQ